MTFPWLFHDQFKFSMTQKCWKPSLLGAYFCSVTRRIFPVFKQHEIFGPKKMKFHDFSMTSAIFPKIHDFSRPGKCIFKFHSWLFMTVWTLAKEPIEQICCPMGWSFRQCLTTYIRYTVISCLMFVDKQCHRGVGHFLCFDTSQC